MPVSSPTGPHSVFLSPFAEALHGRRMGVAQTKLTQALIGYSILYRRFQRALARALTSFKEYEDRRAAEGWESHTTKGTTAHLDDFLEAVYVAAELFEFYETDLIELLNPSGKARSSYRASLRAWKRFAVLICNRCKHNFAFLQSIEVLYESGLAVSGFCTFMMHGPAVVPVAEIHIDAPCFSFNWAFRRLLTDLLQADLGAAELVKAKPDKGHEELASLSYTLPFLDQAIAISNLPVLAMPQEQRGAILTVTGEGLIDIDLGHHTATTQGAGKMRAYVDLLAPSVTIRLPFVQGELGVAFQNNEDPALPFPGILRVVIADQPVSDGPGQNVPETL